MNSKTLASLILLFAIAWSCNSESSKKKSNNEPIGESAYPYF